MHAVWVDVLAAYDELGVPHSERVPDSKFLRLSGGESYYPVNFPMVSIKAAHCKHLLPTLELVCQKRPCHTLEDRLRIRVLSNLCKLCDIIESHGHHLPRYASDSVLECVTDALLSYATLSSMAYREGRKLWNIVPKFHHFYHIALASKYSNPKCSWVFKEEDFVGRISRIAHSSTGGTPSESITLSVLTKYRQCLELRYQRRRRFA